MCLTICEECVLCVLECERKSFWICQVVFIMYGNYDAICNGSVHKERRWRMYRFCGVGKLGIRRMGMSMQNVVFL